MKVRIITGLVCAVVAIAALVFITTPLMGILCVLMTTMACYEICHVAGVRNKGMIGVAMVAAAALPPLVEYDVFGRLGVSVLLPILAYVFLQVVLMLADFKESKFSDVLFVLLASLAVPSASSAVLLVRNIIRDMDVGVFEKNLIIYFLFFTFCCAWFTDTFAYFVGMKFGKHKLCPHVSPKKTVEGAAGGILLTALANVGFAALFNLLFLEHHRIQLLTVGLMSIPICIASIFGDLAASTLKRNFNAKDFGRLFPGHGGVMDRLDSLSYVAPMMFALLQLQYHFGWALFSRVI
ncbi:MAG: phosphatidate cytidylyltransferase [Oscillospiraceae bacterium]|jgi:phosphatidate cytidylyltransferase|nr:phosphatidate cytidylyltransferase [Oscillospiraceae bacterium]